MACTSEGRTVVDLEQHVYLLCLCGVWSRKGNGPVCSGRERRGENTQGNQGRSGSCTDDSSKVLGLLKTQTEIYHFMYDAPEDGSL